MTDAGEIFINGRKIDELTLNSRTLFKGNKKVLLENLPYFTVKELTDLADMNRGTFYQP